MRTALSWVGRAPLFAAIALCFAPAIVPPFLDRVYYQGPPSDHFDGARFFNPGPAPPARRGSMLDRWAGSEPQAIWPDEVPVRPTVPPRRIEGGGMVVTWIGHATVLVQTEGLNILTDPIWSDRASPFSFTGPRRVRAPGVRFEDLPRIDLVLVSHNHYDHLDLPTLRRLWERDRPLIVTGLGNDMIMAAGGVEAIALDWGGRLPVRPNVEVVAARNHHWSSRWLTDRNRSLWAAFEVSLPGGNVFFAGDTGWGGGSWAREAATHGPYRLAILPIGAYAPREVMRNSHLNPGEALAVFDILRPTMALGMHWGTFQLSWEEIDAPPQTLAELRRARGMPRDRFAVTEVGQSFRVPPLGR
ncbi:MBL fold metallo-hydrolase [Sphingosinicella sp.]|uniref:MBL fold metallo-hydrolase n=1 Tax=Sphingosinicella sp. TaxID=1917971 RepID=UPI004037764F